jgi:hypothetical protein
MNPTELQTILSTLLHEQEQRHAAAFCEQLNRFTQLIETLRVANGVTPTTPIQAMLLETRNSPPPQLPDIEAYVENPTHFEDWLKRFEMSLYCAAPNISDKEKAMVLATKLSTNAFAKF